MRNRAADDGLLMTVLVNTLVLGVVALFMTWPPFDLAGVAALLAGGVVGTVFGRATNLRAVRRIGPTRTNAFLTVNPIVSAIGGWLVLDEAVSLGEAIGGVLVITGLFRLIRRGAVVSAGQGQTMTAPALAAQTAERRTAAGYVYAAAAPVFFGFAFVARKWGLQFFPNAVIGAFIGSAAAFIVVVAGDAFGGRLRERMHHNFREVPWLFVWAGIASSAALLAQFFAFSFAPAWVVGLLQGTQPLWTLALGYLFLRQEEHIDSKLVTSILLVIAGIVAISLQI
jgi:drug/metabolite transporter (DMT)-like permease